MSEQQELITGEKLEFAVIVLPTTQQLLDKIAVDLEEAPSFVVDSADMAAIAVETAGRFATVRDAMDKERLATTAPLRGAVGKINAGYNEAIDRITSAEKSMKAKIVEWNRKVERERREAEECARAEAKKRAAEEAAAARAKEQEAQRLAEAAQAAAKAGDADKAADLIQQAQAQADAARQAEVAAQVSATAPVVVSGARSVKGATETWKARVTDKSALIQHIAGMLAKGDLSLLDVLEVKESSLHALAKIQKTNMKVPGVEAYIEEGLSVRKVSV